MASFASSIGDGSIPSPACFNVGGGSSGDNSSVGGLQEVFSHGPGGVIGVGVPTGGGGDTSGTNVEVDSAAWLDYYDACLRARGVKGGIAEFEEFARLSSQGAAMTAFMGGGGVGMPGGGGGHHRTMPQDRPFHTDNNDNKDDIVPAGFEYDDSSTAARLTEQQLEALQAEEDDRRRKKAAKKRDKKARQKERAKREAEAKAAAAATRKREKAITSWRSRVVAACGSGDVRKMDVLVGESPYKSYVYDLASAGMDDGDEEEDTDRPKTQDEYLSRQMDWFLPNCLQKYQISGGNSQPYANNQARECLAKYILSVSFDVVLMQSHSSTLLKRNALHSAAYKNDADLIQWIIETQSISQKPPAKQQQQQRGQHQRMIPEKDYLESLCEDGGWTPLHYATAGGAETVVELLLMEGVCVTTRTERSLTCFNRRRGNGITARELAIVLQSGAVDDDLTSDADILDEIVENRIENVSANDKAAYMRILKNMETRLANVENHGYTPPMKKAVAVPAGPRESLQPQDSAGIVARGGAGQSTMAATKKFKKKNKKKQQQHVKAAPTPAAKAASLSHPETKPASQSSPPGDDDMTDPVAVALLGMGFAEDQIKSAARALGGFHRATADDMVMWILGGGELADNNIGGISDPDNYASAEEQMNNSNADDADNTDDVKNSGEVLTKAQKKAATRARREAEEAVRRRGEEDAAARRAAAKREEQRRIRREWNEREQARQLDEKNARMAEAMERRRRAEIEKVLLPKGPVLPAVAAAMTPVRGAGAVVPPAAIHVSGVKANKHHHHPHHISGGSGGGGPPLTIIAGGQKMPSGKSKKQHQPDMGIPQAPAVRAPKILARPSNAPVLPGGASANVMQQQVIGAGSQLLFASSAHAQPSVAPSCEKLSSPQRGIHGKPYKPVLGHHHPAQYHHPHHQSTHQQPIAILQKASAVGHPGGHHQSTANARVHQAPEAPIASSGHHRHHPIHHASANYGSNAAAVTPLSSMGSGAVPQLQKYNTQGSGVGGSGGSAAPPGFRPSGDTVVADAPATAEPLVENPMGMIRATAREFVPTSFKMSRPLVRAVASPPPPPVPPSEPVPTDVESNIVPSMSAQAATMSAVRPLAPDISSPPRPAPIASNNRPSAPTAALLVEPMSSLLSSFGAGSSDDTPPPATALVPVLGGNREDYSTGGAPSAASSITGFSGLPQEGNNATTSRVGSSVMTFESTSSSVGGVGGAAVVSSPATGGIRASSILESVSYGAVGVGVADTQNIENIATGSSALPPVTSSGIGLWGGGNNVNVNVGRTSAPSLGLAGLNFSSFMGGDNSGSSPLGNRNNNDNTGNISNVRGDNTWGASTSGSGSIW